MSKRARSLPYSPIIPHGWGTCPVDPGDRVRHLVVERRPVEEFTMADTIGDLVADSLGALAAAVVALYVRRRGKRLT